MKHGLPCRLLSATILLFILINVSAQSSSQYKDCNTAFPICEMKTYHFGQMDGFGLKQEAPEQTSCFASGFAETNSFWITWTAATPGTLTFVINPNNVDDDFDLIELYLQVDSFHWPRGQSGIVSLEQCLPLQWLFRIGSQLHSQQWKAGPDTTIETGAQLGPNTQMTAWWFADEKEHWSTWTREDGKKVQLMRMVPIYSEEIQLIQREGGVELIRRFAAEDLYTVLDPHRTSFA